MSVDLAHDHAREDHEEYPQIAAVDSAPQRSVWKRLLWGKKAEFCAECGVELEPGGAYRDSARDAYCSVEHAEFDR